jgi:hypothetical protein
MATRCAFKFVPFGAIPQVQLGYRGAFVTSAKAERWRMVAIGFGEPTLP